MARAALEVAAAGGHHLLMTGPPGGGKTMLAERLPGLLPDLDDAEALAVTSVHSAAGRLRANGAGLIRRPPLRAPHHTASLSAMVGGGSAVLRPGEVSLASGGVLFLDELGEFPAAHLDALRQPLESGLMRVARAALSVELPARVLLVGATNPCPCGFAGFGDCRCTEAQLTRYRRRLSGPLLDRFDLRLAVGPPDPSVAFDGPLGEPSAAVAPRVAAARARAAGRGVRANRELRGRDLRRVAPLEPPAERLLPRPARAGGADHAGSRAFEGRGADPGRPPRPGASAHLRARRGGPAAAGRRRRTGGPPVSGGGGGLPAGEAGLVAALASLDGVGPARLAWLLARGAPADTWDRVARGALRPPAGPGPRVDAAVLARWRQEVRARPDLPAQMSARLAGLGARVLVGRGIPEHFGGDPEPPPALFVRGELPPLDAPRVAIVGTRRASPYGLRIATSLGRDLAAEGVGVVSGLALGIDAAAHAGAVEGPGVPVAVVGAGHDRPCPSRNRALGRRVAASGAVVGEVPPGVASAPWRYPARNRLIAALAHVVVVVESASAGGSMSTVAEALARDRSVMAVPGPVGRASSDGCHDLLRDGAEICTGAQDVLALLGLSSAAVARHASGAGPVGGAEAVGDADPVQQAVLDALADGPLSADAVMSRTGTGLGEVSAALGSLVAGGWVARRGGWVERLR